mmetsp:Transcript_36898/g.62162  ORF Transcript_36898/g.62162 Transcript_36898/m.62162 type:complete len:84 (-) Transcript_36898:531-782(-)
MNTPNTLKKQTKRNKKRTISATRGMTDMALKVRLRRRSNPKISTKGLSMAVGRAQKPYIVLIRLVMKQVTSRNEYTPRDHTNR